MKQFVFAALSILVLSFSCTNKVEEKDFGSYTIVSQTKGATLGYSAQSGVKILTVDGYAFKDLNRNDKLDVYEDWRKPVKERAADLASQMSLEQICGLMIYSSAQHLQSDSITDKQRTYILKDNVRHMLVASVPGPGAAARWSNNVQALCEAAPLGIPSNNSSDPRHYTNGSANISNFHPEPDGEFDPQGANDISKWPREMGLAATFDPELVKRHGEIAALEYRSIGITTALSPQVDIATEPRWRRFYATFSEDPYLCRDMAQAYCDGFQNTEGSASGWGEQSVNCMVKHWPGGGTGEGGRDAHFGIGKYAVYPGGRFDLGLIPFVDGAFKLKGKTQRASAVMPYYTISYNQDPSGVNVANGFSRYIIKDLLRDGQNYDGVICTDWGIVNDYIVPWKHDGKPWGVEKLSPVERRLLCFELGIDQLGGVRDNETSIAAYHLWEEKYGRESARERFELSACRLLVNIFNVGLFENPYVSPEKAETVVGCKEFVSAGYQAQLKSVIMLKNAGTVIPAKTANGNRLKVYEPLRHSGGMITHWRVKVDAYDEMVISKELLSRYFDVVDTPKEADFALVCIKSPVGHWGYMEASDGKTEGRYMPISLQWGPYTAEYAREKSIAGGDPHEASYNRSYKGATETSSNESDMYLVRDTKAAMGDKPVITFVAAERPFVPAEIEPYSDVLLMAYGVSNNAVLDIISGVAEPSALLPHQLPADMRTVEEQCEDVPRDMRCYTDCEGHTYDFAYGMNWFGVINDARVRRYGGR